MHRVVEPQRTPRAQAVARERLWCCVWLHRFTLLQPELRPYALAYQITETEWIASVYTVFGPIVMASRNSLYQSDHFQATAEEWQGAHWGNDLE